LAISNGVRIGALILIDLVAWVIFTVGLIAPLTPSDGPPGFGALAMFAGLPTLLLLAASSGAKSRLSRILLVAQGLAIPALTAWLVY
jgi:hypothetical protein